MASSNSTTMMSMSMRKATLLAAAAALGLATSTPALKLTRRVRVPTQAQVQGTKAQLLEMGFSLNRVNDAILRFGDDTTRAATYLITHAVEDADRAAVVEAQAPRAGSTFFPAGRVADATRALFGDYAARAAAYLNLMDTHGHPHAVECADRIKQQEARLQARTYLNGYFEGPDRLGGKDLETLRVLIESGEGLPFELDALIEAAEHAIHNHAQRHDRPMNIYKLEYLRERKSIQDRMNADSQPEMR